jgi:hypothetical protein
MGNNAQSVGQMQSERMDSIYEVITDLSNEHNMLMDQLDTILDRLCSISVYGVGFSDATAHITIPLIISLFAFAFPFLFTIISHINNKYEEEPITKMLATEKAYKWFLRGAGICAIFLIMIGILSLSLKNSASYPVLMTILNWLSVFVAGGYSFVIVWFVKVCLDYNSPQKILSRVEVHFEHGAKRSGSVIKALKKKDDKNKKKTVDVTQKFKATSIGINRLYAYAGEEDLRLRRLVALCSYAIKKQDNHLFLSVVSSVSRQQHPDTKQAYHDFLFYEDIMNTYLFCHENVKVEETLMMYWFLTFKHNRLLNLADVCRMFEKVLTAVRHGRIGLFENYLVKSKYGYHFVHEVPVVAYVCGQDVAGQKKIDDDRRELWRELTEMHYLALAHLFSLGHNEIIKVIISGDNLGYDRLLPGSGIEVLRYYARCKENQLTDGGFSHYWFSDTIIGENPDVDLLEKFTAILLLLTPATGYDVLCLIGEKQLNILRNAKEKIVYYGNLFQENNDLSGQYPQIKEIEIEKNYNLLLRSFEDASEINSKKINSSLLRIVYEMMAALGKPKQEKKKRNVYSEQISQTVIERIRDQFEKIIYGNHAFILDGLDGKESPDKTEAISMGSYSYLVYKLPLLSEQIFENDNVFWGVSRVFKSRFLFVFYMMISRMKITEKSIPIDEFEKFYIGYVRNKGEDYTIIDSDSHLNLFYDLDELNDGRRSSFDRTYKGSDYKNYDLSVEWYLRDVEEIEPFKNTLIIIKKSDLPFVYSTVKENAPSVSVHDESDQKKGSAVVRITVNPNWEAKYCKESRVLKIRLLPVKGKY